MIETLNFCFPKLDLLLHFDVIYLFQGTLVHGMTFKLFLPTAVQQSVQPDAAVLSVFSPSPSSLMPDSELEKKSELLQMLLLKVILLSFSHKFIYFLLFRVRNQGFV